MSDILTQIQARLYNIKGTPFKYQQTLAAYHMDVKVILINWGDPLPEYANSNGGARINAETYSLLPGELAYSLIAQKKMNPYLRSQTQTP